MLNFDNTFARSLDGLYVACRPDVPAAPHAVVLNEPLARDLGLDVVALRAHGADLLSGARLPDGAEPLAQAYAGHQFGGLSPQLGDGRAHLLGEIVDPEGRRWDLQLKGSGRTVFSRGGDGKAALGPMLREYVIGEAMHALGIPTSRALAVVATGESVRRDGPLPGAVLARVAASHLRIGTFEFFAIRGDVEAQGRLLDYTLARHFPDADHAEPALSLLTAVRDTQARLVAQWMAVGFLHGVMNTDNVALSGETIDYGPCAFLDAHDPAAVFSSIDRGGRYAYGNQPRIMAWNLARLASALLPLIDDDADVAVGRAQPIVEGFAEVHERALRALMARKLGFSSERAEDPALIDALRAMMAAAHPDHTLTFRRLADAARGEEAAFVTSFSDPDATRAWLARWRARLAVDGAPAERAAAMDRINPLVIPRNHQVEAALTAAVAGDLAPLDTLVEALRAPFQVRPGREALTEPAPAAFTACYQTFCGT